MSIQVCVNTISRGKGISKGVRGATVAAVCMDYKTICTLFGVQCSIVKKKERLFTIGKHEVFTRQFLIFSGVEVPANSPQGQTVYNVNYIQQLHTASYLERV